MKHAPVRANFSRLRLASLRTLFPLVALALALALPPGLRAQAVPITNPGFESGSLSGWSTSYGTRSVVGATTSAGNYSGKVAYGSAIAQTVTGLSPNTSYVLTGRLKLEIAGQIAYLGVNNHGGASVSAPTSLASFTQKSVVFTTGPSSTSANIFVYQGGSGSVYCDELGLRASGGGANLLANPGFESGSLSGWASSYGTFSLANATGYAGDYAGKVATGGAIAQTLSALSPSTTYTLTGWLKVETAGQVAYLGVNNHGGTSVSAPTSLASFTQKSVVFTTGPSSTSANIFVYQSGSGSAYCDEFAVEKRTGDTGGVQAARIADCLERFGVNTFSRLALNGVPWAWGGSQGDYDAATTARAINYLTAGSGLNIHVREYHRDYVGNPPQAVTPQQKTWIRDVHQATGSTFSIAINANGGSADIPGIVDIVQDSVASGLNHVKWVEGINEPNVDFGQGTIPAATTASVQAALRQQISTVAPGVLVAGPSVAFGLPTPDISLGDYLGAYAQSVRDNSDLSNLHVYPPKSPNAYDGGSRGGALADIDIGFQSFLPGPALNTEWHPTLYSQIHKNDPAYDAYWAPIYLISSSLDFGWEANFWFALFDYNSVWMKCGLFATNDATPYPVANALRALYQLTGDTGADKRTFAPGKLDVAVSGLPAAPANSPHAGGRWALFQNSARTYFLFLWNEQNDLGAASVPVTIAFNSHAMAQVQEFNITSGGTTALRTLTGVGGLVVNLDTSLRLLRITY